MILSLLLALTFFSGTRMIYSPPVAADTLTPAVDLVLLPANQTVNAGDIFSVTIQAQCNGREVTGISVSLDFDKSRLAAQMINSGDTLNTVLRSVFNNDVGTIDYSAGKISAPMPSGTFTVATINFKALAATESSPITFAANTNNTLRTTMVVDYNGDTKLLRNTIEASIHINGAPATTASGGGSAANTPAPAPSSTAPTSPISLPGFIPNPVLKTDASGLVQDTVWLNTADTKTSLFIQQGTKLLDAGNQPLKSITSGNLTSPPSPLSGTTMIYAANFGPDGAKFDPPLTLTVSFEPKNLPEGALESDLYLAYWDGNAWAKLEGMPDATLKTVSAKISHFTGFALFVKGIAPAPAAFTLAGLKITPNEVGTDEPVTIQITAANNGGSQGEYTLTLKVNNVEVEKKEITLGAGKTETVSFQDKRSVAGKYMVDINGNTAEYTVKAGVLVSTSNPVAGKVVETSINWTMYLIIGAGVVLVLAVGLIIWRRRA
jgi:hypothetical protein